MPSPVRSTPSAVLLAVLAKLQAFTGFPAERAFLFQGDDLPYDAHGDQVLFLTLEDGSVDDPIEAGAGRVDTREADTLTVTVRTRLMLDEPYRSASWLTDASLGHLGVVHKVKDALCEFYPADANGNTLTTEGLKLVRPGRPRMDRKAEGWGESKVSFKAVIELDLDQSVQ